MGLSYCHPAAVMQKQLNKHLGFSTTQGGFVYSDCTVHDVWQNAITQSALITGDQADTHPQGNLFTMAALACLSEAGLLLRLAQEDRPSPGGYFPTSKLVSAIIVSHNSLEWLKANLPALLNQDYSPSQTILVDNASQDETVGWIRDNYPEIQLYHLPTPRSLATAINHGISKATGKYFFLLNPDTTINPATIFELVKRTQNAGNCAAVAAKLKFTWAPSFLNGLGNFVGGVSWGTDCALGHLDLGQFDHWEQVPSTCFAAALISADAWKEIGPLDEGFPMYYEDSEWCYRARLMGYSILAAPHAVVYHAFGGQKELSRAGEMGPAKLRNVAYGRLRFASLLFSFPTLLRFLVAYLLEDIMRIVLSVITGHLQSAAAHLRAWQELWKSLPEIKVKRKAIQKRRKISDRQLLSLQRQVPMPLIRHGFPLLTSDIIENEYLPLILSGKTRPLPEFLPENNCLIEIPAEIKRRSCIKRMIGIWQAEGLQALIHRVGKWLEWRLMRI